MSIHNDDSSDNQPIWVDIPEFVWDASGVATYPIVLQHGSPVGPILFRVKQDVAGHLPADNVAYGSDLVQNPDDIIVSLEAGDLPSGLTLVDGVLSGTVGVLPKDVSRYQTVVRVLPIPPYISTDPAIAEEQFVERTIEFRVHPINEGHSWNPAWLTAHGVEFPTTGETVYILGSLTRGQAVNIQLEVLNPDQDPLTFTVVSAGPNFAEQPTLIPAGLSIDNLNRIVGVPNATNPEGAYYFRIRVSDGTDSGNPPTDSRDYVFKFVVDGDVSVDPQPSDDIQWVTPAFLGSTYENFPSHFTVQASTPGSASIQYALAPGSNPLPSGLTLAANTGMIVGILPFVPATVDYTFTIRASIGNSYVDRVFTIRILNLYKTGGIECVWATLNELSRSQIATWMWSVNLIPESKYFRFVDPNFGRIRQPKMYIVNGLYVVDPETFQDHLRDYHREMKLRLGDLRTAKAYDPSGAYIYDIIYFHVIDPQDGSGGFDSFGREQKITYPHGVLPAIPTWNLVAGQNNDRYHPNSIMNARMDFISKKTPSNPAARINWPAKDPAHPENDEAWMDHQTADDRGIGLSGGEGMPLWMSCRQVPGDPSTVLGFQPSVEVAYVQPGSGRAILNTLKNAGMEEKFNGLDFTVDRYLLTSVGSITTTFDFNLLYDYTLTYPMHIGQTTVTIHADITPTIKSVKLAAYTGLDANGYPTWGPAQDVAYTVLNQYVTLTVPANDKDILTIMASQQGVETIFDGPDLPVTPTPDYTSFDYITITTPGKYYKFPPGDRKAG